MYNSFNFIFNQKAIEMKLTKKEYPKNHHLSVSKNDVNRLL